MPEPVEELIDRIGLPRGLPRDGLDHRKEVLRPVSQLPQQEPELLLARRALGVEEPLGVRQFLRTLIEMRLEQRLRFVPRARPLASGVDVNQKSGGNEKAEQRERGPGFRAHLRLQGAQRERGAHRDSLLHPLTPACGP
ncbi:MAG: hypothetical protein A49_12420 [Methyloceanibacter sp.]|nr:MAG: hypothetical protein A49_12420 [Methyloceanibacter sp.]